MSVNVEKLEGNMAVLTIEVDAEEVNKAITQAYNKIKNQITLPGFRKGKAPQKVVEQAYGVEVFYEDAADILINNSYPAEAKSCTDVEIVSQPQINIVQLEKGKNFIYTAEVAVRPEVTLGEYKGLEYTEFSVEASEEDITREIEAEREKNSRQVPVEGRPAQDGDTVTIDFDGYVDGKQFDGGKAEGYGLVLGSHSFIDTFEDQIVGHNIGDEFDVNVTFPDQYGTKALEGKPAVFKVKLHEIKEKSLPELDDEFAAEVSEFDTLEEYKADVKTKIEERKLNDAKNRAKDQLIAKVVETSEMEIPEVMINEQADTASRQMQMNLQQYGISMQQYLDMLGQTPQQYFESQKPGALRTIQSRLVLEAIAKAEGLEASEDDVQEQYNEMAEVYQMSVEKIMDAISPEELEDLKSDIAASKAADFLFDNATAVAAPAEEETPDVIDAVDADEEAAQ